MRRSRTVDGGADTLRRLPTTGAATAALATVWAGAVAGTGLRARALQEAAAPRWFDPLLVVVLVLAVLALVVTADVRRRARPRRVAPAVIQRPLLATVEASALGVGSLRRWTSTNPDVGLGSVRQPAPVSSDDGPAPDGSPAPTHPPSHRPDVTVGAHRVPPATGGIGSMAGTHQRPTPDPVGSTAAPPVLGDLIEHVVERGQTWWTLAETRLGGGQRWSEIQAANLGREAAPGVVIDEHSILRPGWSVLVPRSAQAGPTSMPATAPTARKGP